jgi:hypothetical protein
MQCPNCRYVSKDNLIKCSACGHVYAESALEGLRKLEYLAGWLDEHQDELAAPGHRRLRQATEQQLVDMRRKLVPPAASLPDSALAAEAGLAPAALPQAAHPPSIVKPAPVAQQKAMPQPVVVKAAPVVAAPQIVAAPPRPAPAPHPVRPPRPPINWSAVWERAWQLAVSGALLRGLLYLGAFMIVASAVVLVVRFWNNFPGLLQIGFVAAVPMSFYAGGITLRRMKIPVAGSVFTGIGALLVAVDLAAIYQLGGLSRVIDLPVDRAGTGLARGAGGVGLERGERMKDEG